MKTFEISEKEARRKKTQAQYDVQSKLNAINVNNELIARLETAKNNIRIRLDELYYSLNDYNSFRSDYVSSNGWTGDRNLWWINNSSDIFETNCYSYTGSMEDLYYEIDNKMITLQLENNSLQDDIDDLNRQIRTINNLLN